MHKYRNMAAHVHHNEDEVWLIRAVFCPFMRHCCKAQLADNYRNESLWHRSGYFCINICKRGGVFKPMASYWLFTQSWQNRQIFNKAGVVFRKMNQMYLKHKKVSVYRILILACLVSLACIVVQKAWCSTRFFSWVLLVLCTIYTMCW